MTKRGPYKLHFNYYSRVETAEISVPRAVDNHEYYLIVDGAHEQNDYFPIITSVSEFAIHPEHKAPVVVTFVPTSMQDKLARQAEFSLKNPNVCKMVA
ncbi:hypothetical protein NECAME_00298 [Necator americanus]|uniref:Uncharacterized protein n=1 Tax=Necator americanus TaxID=51031 RepID=W2TLP3_NECAM|nr:hypothetical protein NECAME_00298 [Necator americanus]ETN81947.1 hypothetical protein NECAME_00298 [Necator americanus]